MSQKYIFDANIFINFYERNYRFAHFPSFWDKFATIINQYVVIPQVVRDEIEKGEEFKQWLKKHYQENILSHKKYAKEWGGIISYIANNYDKEALLIKNTWARESIADGWLIAIANKENFTIVSDELPLPPSSPLKKTKIPDIAEAFGVRCINMNQFFAEIDFKV